MKKPIPITKPTLESYDAYAPMFRKILKSGRLTLGPYGEEFEKKTAKYLGVKHCVAVSSCTAGLMLVMQGLELTGEVIVPSFTFLASAHAILWSGLTPVFADIDPKTFTVDPRSVEKLITKKTTAILAVHVFGVPANIDALTKIAKKHKLKLIFDAAHAFGAEYKGKKIGNFGDAEVFSLSPIKLLTAVEGGLVATNNDALAAMVRRGRNYGDDGTNNAPIAGLSARLSEFHAAVGLRSFAMFPANLKNRRVKAAYLINALKKLEPRLEFQFIPKDVTTTYYILSTRIDKALLGYSRDELHDFLKQAGILTRKYFYPPIHRQAPYKKYVRSGGVLPVTNEVTDSVLALPLFSHITKKELDAVIAGFRSFLKGRKPLTRAKK
jgi:dTDP-4-amino-4,6-dideoxygalactose transaminase